MKYIRTKDSIYKVWNWWNNSGSIPESDVEIVGCYVGNEKDININDIIKQADTIEDLIQPGDIIFYFDFHSQKEQCMYLNYILGIKDINITKLLIPVEDDYRCVAKAEHEYHQFGNMKQVIKKGDLELL